MVGREAADLQALDRWLERARSGWDIDVDSEARQRLGEYVRLLRRAQPAMNLIGPVTADELARDLIVDSLSVLAVGPWSGRLVDVGSGAGLPGWPLALCRPEAMVTLLEPRDRRFRFLGHVARRLGHTRVERVRGRLEEVDRDALVGSEAHTWVSKAVMPVAAWLASFDEDAHVVAMCSHEDWLREGVPNIAARPWRAASVHQVVVYSSPGEFGVGAGLAPLRVTARLAPPASDARRAIACVVCDESRVLMVRRGPDRYAAGYWTPVTGGVEGDEAPIDAAKREVGEETGIQAKVAPETFYRCLTERRDWVLDWKLATGRGTPAPQLSEVDRAEWLSWDEALSRRPMFGSTLDGLAAARRITLGLA